jgi:SAM-dependent methyltransferase
MAPYTKFYQLARYYDIGFRRDAEIDTQMDFVWDVYQHYCGKELDSLLDIACGPGYHAAAAAKRGIYAVGLDLVPEMLDYAQGKLEPGLKVDWVAADMREFQLPHPVDMAINMFDGLDALAKNADVVHHLRNVAGNLNPGGLYLIQHTHPRDCSLNDYGDFEYQGESNGTNVRVKWATNHPRFDLVTSVAHVEITLYVSEDGEEKVFHDEADERLFSPQELQLLAELSGVFEVLDFYGDFDLDQPLDHSERSRTMLLVLRKKG